jgi:hypothetical protein
MPSIWQQAVNAKKAELVAEILSQRVYLPESRLYQMVQKDLLKLSLPTISGLHTILSQR